MGSSQKKIALILIFILPLLAFWPALDNNFVDWDDPIYLLNNPSLQKLSWQNIKKIFTEFTGGSYHPLTTLSYALEYHGGQFNPLVYHATNIVLHLLNTLLVFVFVTRLAPRPLVGLCAALLFGIHPMRVESVAWITARKDVLFTFFYLCALLTYLHSHKMKNPFPSLVMTSALFLFSLFSKPAAVTFPLVILTLDWQFYLSSMKKRIPWYSLLLAAAALFGALAIFGCRFKQTTNGVYLTSLIFNTGQRFFLSFYALFFYIGKFFLPMNLKPFYYYPLNTPQTLPALFILAPFLYMAFVLFMWKLAKGRAFMNFCLLFFHLTILLNLPLIGVGHTLVADRFTYLPYLGLMMLCGYGISFLYDLASKKKETVILLAVAGSVLITGLVHLTRQQCRVWKNSLTLWTAVLEHQPPVYLAHYHRAEIFMKKNDLNAALQELNAAIILFPRDGELFYKRGILFSRLKRLALALEDLNNALTIAPEEGRYLFTRGGIYFLLGKCAEALKDYEKLLRLDPTNEQAILQFQKIKDACPYPSGM